MKYTVTERALLARINRKLLKSEGSLVRKCRENSRGFSNVGFYYEIDISRNAILATHIGLEDYGRELGVLKRYEKVEWD